MKVRKSGTSENHPYDTYAHTYFPFSFWVAVWGLHYLLRMCADMWLRDTAGFTVQRPACGSYEDFVFKHIVQDEGEIENIL